MQFAQIRYKYFMIFSKSNPILHNKNITVINDIHAYITEIW